MPDQTIYFQFEKATGLFAGSGTVFVDDETYGCTTVVPGAQPDEPVLKWDADNQKWIWWVPVG